jgi:hypothetical protein
VVHVTYNSRARAYRLYNCLPMLSSNVSNCALHCRFCRCVTTTSRALRLDRY